MSARRSEAIGMGIAAIESYFDMDLSSEDGPHVDSTELGQFLGEIGKSVRDLRLSSRILELRGQLGGAYETRTLLGSLSETEFGFEYLWATLCLQVLYSVEANGERLPALVRLLPDSDPPKRSLRYLSDIAQCYLIGLDAQCIVSCRAAVEVLVENLGGDLSGVALGAAIRTLRDTNRISPAQAADMFEVNRQAREAIHDEPAHRAPSAEDCVARVSRLLAQLSPAAWE